MRERRVYKGPVLAKVYVRDDMNRKLKKESEYRTNKGLEKKLSLFAEVMPDAQVYVVRRGEWYRVKMTQEHRADGELKGWGWELVESDGVTSPF